MEGSGEIQAKHLGLILLFKKPTIFNLLEHYDICQMQPLGCAYGKVIYVFQNPKMDGNKLWA